MRNESPLEPSRQSRRVAVPSFETFWRVAIVFMLAGICGMAAWPMQSGFAASESHEAVAVDESMTGASKLGASVLARLESIGRDAVDKPAAAVQAEMDDMRDERGAASAYEQSLKQREEQVAASLSYVDPAYLAMQDAGPGKNSHIFRFDSVEQLVDEGANNDGTLGLWRTRWYTAHDWSDIGKEIASMRPNDIVVVDDTVIEIDGKFIWPQESNYYEILHRIGWEKTVFQTCLGDEVNIWIVYGHEV